MAMTTNAMETAVASPRGLAQLYVPQLPDLDEMVEPDGSLRACWRPFVSMMDDLGREEVLSRWEQARRLIRENGITHNVYGDPNGWDRPWSMDLLPLLMSVKEWQTIGESLTQRARLLNALLADLHGPATCVSNGVLPPELVYANPRFLRAAHGLRPPENLWIHVYAADLVRRSDGVFQVLGDRTQAPSGTGYSLENRIVLTRALPTVFRECHVLRLAPFFIALRQTLASLASAGSENPRVVLLTPGPYNETYFEHAYLARYLGYTLVQGNDLTVRDGCVFLKTLGGLQRVDVILRRVDDDFCDPLELYPHSFLGVPGLMQAVRDGTVAVANAIGTGLVEAPAFLPFFGTLCRHFLGEELKIASVPTWWCGQHQGLQFVLENLARLVVKPAFPLGSSDPVICRELSKEQLAELAAKIQGRPGAWVGQEQVDSFSAPVLLDDQVQSRQLMVRAFLAASNGSYTVMPGGLTRVSKSADSLLVSLQKGGGSKDTWILADGPVSEVTLLPAMSGPVELTRGGGDLPSRVADDLYWLGRYIQRAEAVVRLARCIFNRLSDPNAIESPRTIERLMNDLVDWPPKVDSGTAGQLARQMFGPGDPSGLRSSIDHFYRLARVLRDRISLDAWRILSQIEQDVAEFDGLIEDDQIDDVLVLLNRLVAGFLAIGGISADAMTRGQAWCFQDLGVRIERAISTSDLICSTLLQAAEEESFLLDALLEIGDSSLTYRRRYLTQLQAAAVVDLLVADEDNPRSVAFQIAAVGGHLASLPRESNHPHRNPDLQLVAQLRTHLRLADLRMICEPIEGRRATLGRVLADVVQSLTSISESVTRVYFSHALAVGMPQAESQEGGA
jgi:uncharacterized circularly permuted ATP-grasp superfamily protein/uncharacterized alpha-E superfamily protein